MTFTTRVKDEISSVLSNSTEARSELSAFIRYAGKIENNKISLVLENAGIARRIYKYIKVIYGINMTLNIRVQKRFRNKHIYILSVVEKANFILKDLNIVKDNKKVLIEDYMMDSIEEKTAYLKGLFLACGNISDPKTSGYHMEFVIKSKKEADFIIKLLKEFEYKSKYIKRETGYMIYIKEGEKISDILKLFGAINSLFYFEDIRIYRDHKNMVNRLNNCEIANQEKVIKSGLEQLKNIEYLKAHDLLDLLDEKTKLIIEYREKYSDISLQELADIISLETEYKIGKSGINHHFIKIKELIRRHKEKEL